MNEPEQVADNQPVPSRRVCIQCRAEKVIGAFYVAREHTNHYRLFGCSMPCIECARTNASAAYYKCYEEELRLKRETPEYKAKRAEYMQTYRQLPVAKSAKRGIDSARYAKTRGAPSATLTRKEWLEITEVFGHHCAYCVKRST
jgi:hypothetical protein